MAVKIGSARIDENGHAYNGKAGDQTGREVSTQSWYLHSKGWRVFRAKDPAKSEKIAKCMQAACDNKHIGYDQWQRNSLYNEAAKYGYDASKVTKDVETDCSALVRVCCAFAGIMGLPADFRTGNMPSNLLKTGAFVELTDSKYTKQDSYLKRGDILVTKTNGHTVVALSNGSKAASDTASTVTAGLSRGAEGDAVKAMQRLLLVWKADCLPKYGADGDFGSETEKALKAFQKEKGLTVNGIYDKATEAALKTAGALGKVRVTGSSVYVRSAPNTNGRTLGVVHQGDLLPYQGEDSPLGWHLVIYQGENAWISGKYSAVER